MEDHIKQYSDLLDLAEANLTAALSLVQAQKQCLSAANCLSEWTIGTNSTALQFLNTLATLGK